MRFAEVAALIGALSLFPASLQAQERWGFDVRAGAALATTELGDADLETGFGFEGTIMLRAMEHVFVYGGWDWHRWGAPGPSFFPSDESFAGTGIDFEETG